jgi:hypothetical protein
LVTDNILLGSLRSGETKEQAAAIAARAAELSALDNEVAGKITTAIARVNSAQFGDNPPAPNKKPEIPAVDYALKPLAPVPDPGVPGDPVDKRGPTGVDVRAVIGKMPEGAN